MTYSASIEWLCDHAGCLRLHTVPDGHWSEASPYDWSCTVARYGELAELKGVCKPLPGSEAARAVVEALRADGMTKRRYERPRGLVVKDNA